MTQKEQIELFALKNETEKTRSRFILDKWIETLRHIFRYSVLLKEKVKFQTFPKVAWLVIIPELQGLVDTSGRTAWHSCSKQPWHMGKGAERGQWWYSSQLSFNYTPWRRKTIQWITILNLTDIIMGKNVIMCCRYPKLRLTFVSVKVNLYSGVSTGIKDLPGVNLDNGHGEEPWNETQKWTLSLSGDPMKKTPRCTVTCAKSHTRQKSCLNSRADNCFWSKNLCSFLLETYLLKYPDLSSSLAVLTSMLLS